MLVNHIRKKAAPFGSPIIYYWWVNSLTATGALDHLTAPWHRCESSGVEHSLLCTHQLNINNANAQGEWEDSGGWQNYFLTHWTLMSGANQGLTLWDLSLSVRWQLDNAVLIHTPSSGFRALRAERLSDTHTLNDFLFLTVKASYFCRSSPTKIFLWQQPQVLHDIRIVIGQHVSHLELFQYP